MKYLKKLCLALVLFVLSTIINAQELSLTTVPGDVRSLVILALAKISEPEHACKDLRALSLTCRQLSAQCNDSFTISLFIALLSQAYEGNSFKAAYALRTSASFKWLLGRVNDSTLFNCEDTIKKLASLPATAKVVVCEHITVTPSNIIHYWLLIHSVFSQVPFMSRHYKNKVHRLLISLNRYVSTHINELVALYPNFAELFSKKPTINNRICLGIRLLYDHKNLNLTPTRIIYAHTRSVSALVYLTETIIATGSLDGTIAVLDLGANIRTTLVHNSAITALDAKKNRYLYAACEGSNNLRRYDLAQGIHVDYFVHGQNTENQITDLCTLSQNKAITVSSHGTLFKWDIKNGRHAQSLHIGVGQATTKLAYCSKTAIALLCLPKGRIFIVSFSQNKPSLELSNQQDVACMAALGPQTLALGLKSGHMRLMNVETGSSLQTLDKHDAPITALATVKPLVIITGSQDGTINLWTHLGILIQTLRTMAGPIKSLGSWFNNQTDNLHIAVGFKGGSVRIYTINLSFIIEAIKETMYDKNSSLQQSDASHALTVEQALALAL